MDLKTYIETNKLTVAEVARVTNIPINNIYRWMRKGCKPPIPIYMLILEKFTKGNVTRKDFL